MLCNAGYVCAHLMCSEISLPFKFNAFMVVCARVCVCVSAPSVMPLTDGTTAAAINVLFLLLKITLCWLAQARYFTESFPPRCPGW